MAEKETEQETTGLLPAGTIIDGKYEVIAHIGSGGMGEVYKVKTPGSESFYALKMLSPQLAAQKLMSKRLENEARAARTLAHGNIVSIYDVGASPDGAPYLVMDFIEGDSLDAILKKDGMLAQERALPIFIQIAEALVHARQKSVLHRDLKPSNIIVSKTEGGNDLIKIVDFGIAKVAEQESVDKTKLTQAGELLGTPLYMSPEQCRGEELDGRSDIYSFGCLMFEVLTGRAAFAAENQVLVILKHLSDDRPVLPNGAGISADLKAMITRCLEKEAKDRYDNAVTLQIDLERVNDGRPIQARPHRFRMPRKKGKVLLAAFVGVGLFAGLALPNLLHSTAPSTTIAPPANTLKPQAPRAEMYKGKTLAEWTEAIEKDPENPMLYFSRGELHAERDERTNAIDDYTQAISLKPNFLQAYCQRCVQYALIAKSDKAEEDANKAIALDPEAVSGYESLGWVYSIKEQYDKAIEAWKKAASISDSGYYHYSIANDLIKLARFEEAAAEINKANEMNSDVPNWHGISGLIATLTQNYTVAKEQLKLATEGEQTRGVEWQELSYYYVCTGDMNHAEKAIEQAKAIETFPARAYRLAGELYRTAGLLDKAIQQFSASTSLEEYPPGYRERAIVYIALGQWRSALEDLRKSLKLNPYSSNTLSYLALTENHLGMKKQAEEHIAAAFKNKSLPPMNFVNRGAIALFNGDANAALKDADAAIKVDPWLKEAYALRAQIHDKLNDANAANADKAKASKLVSHLDI